MGVCLHRADIIHNPTIGSGPLALPVDGLVSHDDYDSLNAEAAASPNQSKRLEGTLDYVQNLLKAGRVTTLYVDGFVPASILPKIAC
jgi:hypothetical protein